MQRIQTEKIIADLTRKLVFLVGPRQVGKTWIAKHIAAHYKNPLYLSYDVATSRETIKKMGWSRDTDLVIFDEIHKMRGWKNYLKGVYDTKPDTLHILVTGSARLDAYKNAGDSLAGRYRTHHLMPISYRELSAIDNNDAANVAKLIQRGGFPEPFLAETDQEADVWRSFYAESLIREDVLNFKTIENFKAIRYVYDLLKTKVGSPISYASIAENVGVAPKTVRSYISILESLYIVFTVRPFTKKIGGSILKEPKIYFYDTGMVAGDAGVRFENMIAVSLLKHAHAVSDETGKKVTLATLRNKQKKEVDFVLIKEGSVEEMIEVKLSDDTPADGLMYFAHKNGFMGYQVVYNLLHGRKISDTVEIIKAEDYLKRLYI